MVTRGTAPRLPMLARAIAGFACQTHAARELVIVADAGADVGAVERLAAAAGTVRVVTAEPGVTLGALRNRSVASARGNVVCQWDDDDLHHPERIARQLAAMGAAGACALSEVMLLDSPARVLRWANWAATPAGGHPGTLMARRERMPAYPEAGPQASLGEDLAMWQALAAAGPVGRLGGMPHLYVYVSHGRNSWPAVHHAMLADRLALSRGLLRRREQAIRAGLAPFGLAGMSVEGANGPAFTL